MRQSIRGLGTIGGTRSSETTFLIFRCKTSRSKTSEPSCPDPPVTTTFIRGRLEFRKGRISAARTGVKAFVLPFEKRHDRAHDRKPHAFSPPIGDPQHDARMHTG